MAEADRLFYEQGYEHTSFAAIADAVGISRGNFYYHFKTKDEILDAVIGARVASTRQMLDTWSAQSDAPVERISSFIRIVVTNQAQIMRHGCPVGTLCTELAKLGHPAQPRANQHPAAGRRRHPGPGSRVARASGTGGRRSLRGRERRQRGDHRSVAGEGGRAADVPAWLKAGDSKLRDMNATIPGPDGRPRCRWCAAAPEFVRYHDTEWGFPVADDRRLFEKPCLEGFQPGLSESVKTLASS